VERVTRTYLRQKRGSPQCTSETESEDLLDNQPDERALNLSTRGIL